MIEESELTKAGVFTRTHGVKGELSALLDIDPGFFDGHDCFICMEEGIPTPFFIESFRPKGSHASLIKPCDVDSESDAKLFVGKSIYIDKRAYLVYLDENPDTEGEYASDLVGWNVSEASDGTLIGEIAEVNLDTANPLFIVRRPDGEEVYIPVAEEFITEVDEENRMLSMRLPEGLLDLNIPNHE